MRSFDPWIGPLYKSEGLDGLQLLLLGESHYGEPARAERGVTQHVVSVYGVGVGEKKHRNRFMTTTAKLVLGLGKDEYLTDEARADFWSRVAFANYIQEFVSETAKPRVGPSPTAWESAREPFLQTLDEIKPDALLVLSKGVYNRVQPLLPETLNACGVRHPSVAFSYAKWQPEVQAFLASARS